MEPSRTKRIQPQRSQAGFIESISSDQSCLVGSFADQSHFENYEEAAFGSTFNFQSGAINRSTWNLAGRIALVVQKSRVPCEAITGPFGFATSWRRRAVAQEEIVSHGLEIGLAHVGESGHPVGAGAHLPGNIRVGQAEAQTT